MSTLEKEIVEKPTKTESPVQELHVSKILFGVHVPSASLVVIDDTAFSALSADKKANAFVRIQACAAQVVQWETEFDALRDLRNVRARLKAGEDVTHQLLMNGVFLSPEYLAAAAAFQREQKALLATISRMLPTYVFAEVPKSTKTPLRFTAERVRRNGYSLDKENVKTLIERAGPYWQKPKAATPANSRINVPDRGSELVVYTRTQLAIGCQRVPRWQVEQAAVHFGFLDGDKAPVWPT